MIDANQKLEVLTRIAVLHNADPACISVGAKGAVFYRRGAELLCLCQQGSAYWNDIEAVVIAAQLIERAARK